MQNARMSLLLERGTFPDESIQDDDVIFQTFPAGTVTVVKTFPPGVTPETFTTLLNCKFPCAKLVALMAANKNVYIYFMNCF